MWSCVGTAGAAWLCFDPDSLALREVTGAEMESGLDGGCGALGGSRKAGGGVVASAPVSCAMRCGWRNFEETDSVQVEWREGVETMLGGRRIVSGGCACVCSCCLCDALWLMGGGRQQKTVSYGPEL